MSLRQSVLHKKTAKSSSWFLEFERLFSTYHTII